MLIQDREAFSVKKNLSERLRKRGLREWTTKTKKFVRKSRRQKKKEYH